MSGGIEEGNFFPSLRKNDSCDEPDSGNQEAEPSIKQLFGEAGGWDDSVDPEDENEDMNEEEEAEEEEDKDAGEDPVAKAKAKAKSQGQGQSQRQGQSQGRVKENHKL